MPKHLVATASTTVRASANEVWKALITPAAIKQYMFGATVVSDWKEGGPIVWKGEWQGRPYEDKGAILEVKPGRRLSYSHFSPLAGLPDTPENYHTITVELTSEGAQTRVSLSQDNSATEQERQHSERNWEMLLAALKQFIEKK